MIDHIEESKKLPNVFIIHPKVFEDHRGEYLEIYNKKEYTEVLKPCVGKLTFVEDDISIATNHVLKGIHGDNQTWKLISCLYGRFYLVIINYDKRSAHYGKWTSFVLSDVNRMQILVPPKYGNGHLCITEKSIFHYKQTAYYDLKKQFSIKWNDERFKIWWPIKNPILSIRDEKGDKVYVER